MAKPRLGRGLDALLADNGTSHFSSTEVTSEEGFSGANRRDLPEGIHLEEDGSLSLDISRLIPNPHQPRVEFEEEALTELSQSIKEHGVIQPVTIEDAGDGQFYIIAGERRTRAAKLAGLTKIPVQLGQKYNIQITGMGQSGEGVGRYENFTVFVPYALPGETVEANEKMSVSLTKVLGVIGGVTALKNFATELVNVRGQFQQLEIAFSTMLKSKEKADKLMSELVDIAAKTPFDLQGVASSAKQMIAYGSSAENVGDELVMLGNVAAGVGSQLSEIAYLYGTLRTQGRAYAVDIRQFAGRGIPIYEELAKVLGVTKDEVSGLVKEGKVGFKEVEQAFKNMTSESGIYYNLMQEQSKSLTGQLSNLGDAWDTMLNEIGKDTQGIASAGISGLKGLIENYEIFTFIRIMSILVLLIGVSSYVLGLRRR